MGDCCYARCVCRPRDRKVFEEAGLHDEFEDPDEHPEFPASLSLIAEEADYGLARELAGLRKAGAPFVLWHEEGCEYGPGTCAFDGECFAEAEINHDWDVVVPVGDSGEPVPAAVENARHYLEVVRRARKLIEEG